MVLTPSQMYDIKIGTGNSKAGAVFSLIARLTCHAQSIGCRECYAELYPMKHHQYMHKRYGINYSESIRALKTGGPAELAAAIICAIMASMMAFIRIHDTGDFYSPMYVRAWIIVAQALPNVRFWTYTRAWQIPQISAELDKLAALPNVALWRSADAEIYAQALIDDKLSPWAGIAYQQLPGDAGIVRKLDKSLAPGRFINFPNHGHGGAITEDVKVQKVRNCPAITKELPASPLPHCIACQLCLPKEKAA